MSIEEKIFKMIVILSLMLAATLFFSCQSHEVADEAFEQMKQSRIDMTDSILVDEIVSKDSNILLKRKIAKGIANNTQAINSKELKIKNRNTIDEWTRFSDLTEKTIINNQIEIQDLISKKETSGKLLKKVGNLLKENNEIRIQIAKYKDDENQKLERFIAMVNENLKKLDVELAAIKEKKNN
jgi:predicted signal transduction protein with EAL and GGDEF domain